MRLALVAFACLSAALAAPAALAQSQATPTPGTPGPAPGPAARDSITNPVRPPAEVAPPAGRVEYSPTPTVAPAGAQPQGTLSPAEVRELIDAAAATAKATREGVDYQRVMPDILTQILAKLDKLENKLDKIEDILRAQGQPRRR